jgi:hypothetical protein
MSLTRHTPWHLDTNTKGDIELGFNTGINFSQVGNNTGNSDVSIG